MSPGLTKNKATRDQSNKAVLITRVGVRTVLEFSIVVEFVEGKVSFISAVITEEALETTSSSSFSILKGVCGENG